MATKTLQKALAFCLTAALCMGLFCMQAMAVNEEVIIEEEIFIDDNGLPLVDIPDEPIPITELPEGIEAPEVDTVIEDLPDIGVPLAAVPHTGDIASLWLALSGAGLLGLSLIGGKREKEN